MKGFKERLEKIQVEEPVHIPTLDGGGIAETVNVKVPAWRDPKDGEIYLDTEATAILDKVKARHIAFRLHSPSDGPKRNPPFRLLPEWRELPIPNWELCVPK